MNRFKIIAIYDDGEVVQTVAFNEADVADAEAAARDAYYPRSCVYFAVWDNHSQEFYSNIDLLHEAIPTLLHR